MMSITIDYRASIIESVSVHVSAIRRLADKSMFNNVQKSSIIKTTQY